MIGRRVVDGLIEIARVIDQYRLGIEEITVSPKDFFELEYLDEYRPRRLQANGSTPSVIDLAGPGGVLKIRRRGNSV